MLHAVARRQPNTLVPHLAGPGPIGALTEGASHPCSGGLQLALDELLAGRGSFPYDLADRTLEPIAFGAHFGHVAELAREIRAPLQHVRERDLIALQCAPQVGALTDIGVLLASESPSALG